MLVETVLHGKGTDVVTVRPEATVSEAARLLCAHRIGALVVVDEHEKIVGMLSERDIVRGMALKGSVVHEMQVRELMSADVLVCRPEDSLAQLMSVMTNRRVRHLPVIDGDNRLRGIVTIGDIVKNRLDEATMEVDSLRDYVMAGR